MRQEEEAVQLLPKTGRSGSSAAAYRLVQVTVGPGVESSEHSLLPDIPTTIVAGVQACFHIILRDRNLNFRNTNIKQGSQDLVQVRGRALVGSRNCRPKSCSKIGRASVALPKLLCRNETLAGVHVSPKLVAPVRAGSMR